MAEKSSRDQANIRQKLGLVWRNGKKISQIIKDYFYLPFFLIIILCWKLSVGFIICKSFTSSLIREKGFPVVFYHVKLIVLCDHERRAFCHLWSLAQCLLSSFIISDDNLSSSAVSARFYVVCYAYLPHCPELQRHSFSLDFFLEALNFFVKRD